MANRFENDKYLIDYFPEEHIVEFLMKNKEIEKEDVIAMHNAVLAMTGTEPYATLFMAMDFFSISSEARAEGAKEHYSDFVIVQAFVVKNLAQRLIGNFIMKFNAPVRETRLFSNPDDARVWLKLKIAKKDTAKKNKAALLAA